MVRSDPDYPEPLCVGRQSFRLSLRCRQVKVEPPSRTTRFLSDGRYGVWLAPLQRSLQVLTIGLSGLSPEPVESQPS